MKKPIYKVLYVQVLFAIIIGVLLGIYDPDPLGFNGHFSDEILVS